MLPLLRILFVHDFWLKLFSLVLAILVWLTIYYARVAPGTPLRLVRERLTFPALPVVIMSSAEDVRSFQVLPKEVQVEVEGDPAVLRTLKAEEVRALVDLTGVQTAHDLRKRIRVSTPAGVTHVKIIPEEVQVIYPNP